jgi:Protein of unknown function (DUF1549)/Protein of unknown function (DUF1553)
MIWRNLLFLGLVAAGLVGLTVYLYPRALPQRGKDFNPAAVSGNDFDPVVKKVDAALAAPWEDLELRPTDNAPDLTVARRVSLALTGTTPALQEIRQFEARPASDAAQARERLQWYTEGFFEDRRYADYFAERLARTYVGTENGPFIVYRRRRFVSWLSDQVLANRPYDVIVREMIADEGLWTSKPATNFVTVTIEPDNKKGPNPERLAGRVARAFLGVRFDCAQCHNHPFARWKKSDFQGLAAHFGQVNQGFTGIYDARGPAAQKELQLTNPKTGELETALPAVPFYPELLPDHGPRRQRLATWVTHPRNAYFGRATANRVWALLFGRPLVEPLDDLTEAGEVPRERFLLADDDATPPAVALVGGGLTAARKEAAREYFREPSAARIRALQILADDFVAHHDDLHRLIQVIVAIDAFRRDSADERQEVTEAHEQAWAAFPVSRLRPEQVAGSILQAASLETINQDSGLGVKLDFFGKERQFVERYGDTGDDEFDGRGGTIPQRLLLMNGDVVKEKTEPAFANAASRIASLAPDDRKAIETAYLATLTRRPTPAEKDHFARRLEGTRGDERSRRLEDLFWTLINSTEFSWNH